MTKKLEELSAPLLRLIDANLNRLREGLRVVEDIQRFCFNNKDTSLKIKLIRHKSKINPYFELLKQRDIKNDVSKKSISSEFQRADLNDIQIANIKRAQESARVLEETLKLYSKDYAELFKNIRYELYDIEKIIFSI